jgi:acetolactate synthase regulatory subunit
MMTLVEGLAFKICVVASSPLSKGDDVWVQLTNQSDRGVSIFCLTYDFDAAL